MITDSKYNKFAITCKSHQSYNQQLHLIVLNPNFKWKYIHKAHTKSGIEDHQIDHFPQNLQDMKK